MMKFSLTPVHFTKRRKLFGPLWEPEYAHPELPSWIKINWNEMKLVNSFGVTLALNGTFKSNISGMWFVSRWQSEERLRDCQKCTLSSYKLLCILKAWNENSHAIAKPCNLKQKSRLIITYTLKVCLIKAKIITLRNAFVRDFLAKTYRIVRDDIKAPTKTWLCQFVRKFYLIQPKKGFSTLFVLLIENGWETNWLKTYFLLAHRTPYSSIIEFNVTPVHFTKCSKTFRAHCGGGNVNIPELPSVIKI